MKLFKLFSAVCAVADTGANDCNCPPAETVNRDTGGPDLALIRKQTGYANIISVVEYPFEDGKHRVYNLYGRVTPYNLDLYADVPVGSTFMVITRTLAVPSAGALWIKNAAGKTGWHAVTMA